VNVAERQRLADEKELSELPAQLECPIEVFLEAIRKAHVKNATGPAPSGPTAELLSRRLKKAGFSKMSVGRVARYKHLLEKLRPEVFGSTNSSKVVRLQLPE
jgi:hypothetical protein